MKKLLACMLIMCSCSITSTECLGKQSHSFTFYENGGHGSKVSRCDNKGCISYIIR
jgi:hypothetical protein